MALLSLCLTGLFGVLAVGLRAAIHAHRTGRSPFRRGAGVGGPGAMAGTAIAFVAAPVLDLATILPRVFDSQSVAGLGLALASAGLAITIWSQLTMGDAWRIGVDPSERTRLVIGGPFRWVRNPIYTAMITFAAGLALLVPNVASLGALAFVLGALEWHVRRVEEPYLSDAFVEAYGEYAARVGRFVPGVGRLDHSH